MARKLRADRPQGHGARCDPEMGTPHDFARPTHTRRSWRLNRVNIQVHGEWRESTIQTFISSEIFLNL